MHNRIHEQITLKPFLTLHKPFFPLIPLYEYTAFLQYLMRNGHLAKKSPILMKHHSHKNLSLDLMLNMFTPVAIVMNSYPLISITVITFKEDEMDSECSTHGSEEECIKSFDGKA
jgi:hypothetical protein